MQETHMHYRYMSLSVTGFGVNVLTCHSMQGHLVKCFSNIRMLEMSRERHTSPVIRSMISAEGERVPLPKWVHCLSCLSWMSDYTSFSSRHLRARGSVETWLSSVESAMFSTIKRYASDFGGFWWNSASGKGTSNIRFLRRALHCHY